VDGGNDILAVGTGSIFILSNDGISIGNLVDIQATSGGNVTIDANETNPTGTGSITFGAGSAVLAEGNVIVDATTGAGMTGGPITMDATAAILGSTTAAAQNVFVTATAASPCPRSTRT